MKEKLVHNRQKADYALIIDRLPIIEKRPIIGRLIGSSLITKYQWSDSFVLYQYKWSYFWPSQYKNYSWYYSSSNAVIVSISNENLALMQSYAQAGSGIRLFPRRPWTKRVNSLYATAR